MAEPIEETCADVKTLVSSIQWLRGTELNKPHSRSAIYRGQGDAAWGLVPSAFRPRAAFPTGSGWETAEEYERRTEEALRFMGSQGVAYPTREDAQERLEVGALMAFFTAADEAGLALPEDSQVLRDRLWRIQRAADTEPWPALQVRSILALAQHHGVPTRLLDWTWDWRVAAYFAARDSLVKNTSSLAVWSLDVGILEWSDDPEFRLRVITAPGATNKNLHAQQGLFTLVEPLVPGFDARTPLEVLAIPGSATLYLTKYVLPTTEARNLMRHLADERVTAAALFPGYDGVVRSLHERWWWDTSF